MAESYSKNGVKLRHSFPCPKCRSGLTPVIVTKQTEHGETIRRRGCKECGHKWFTFQEPEYLLPVGSVKWRGSQLVLVQPEAALPQ
jgi:transcription elongation factor Elf1